MQLIKKLLSGTIQRIQHLLTLPVIECIRDKRTTLTVPALELVGNITGRHQPGISLFARACLHQFDLCGPGYNFLFACPGMYGHDRVELTVCLVGINEMLAGRQLREFHHKLVPGTHIIASLPSCSITFLAPANLFIIQLRHQPFSIIWTSR
jgi:hypothetical protein